MNVNTEREIRLSVGNFTSYAVLDGREGFGCKGLGPLEVIFRNFSGRGES
jgi:hypothetical protein